MTSADAAFAGSIPALYDRCLGPLLFEPYAEDIAARAAALRPARILETAAGTGIVTEALARLLPDANLVATDLAQDMLNLAAQRVGGSAVRFEQADAQALSFPDGSFDLVVCQFGVMFFPDRVGAQREARRVLKPGGRYLFNVWNSLQDNPISRHIHEAVAALFPNDPPSFLQRVPFGYHDKCGIERDLRAAGFTELIIETVQRPSRSSAIDAATGLCQGSPLKAEILMRAPERLQEATDAAAAALRELGGSEQLDQPMSAHVVSAA